MTSSHLTSLNQVGSCSYFCCSSYLHLRYKQSFPASHILLFELNKTRKVGIEFYVTNLFKIFFFSPKGGSLLVTSAPFWHKALILETYSFCKHHTITFFYFGTKTFKGHLESTDLR